MTSRRTFLASMGAALGSAAALHASRLANPHLPPDHFKPLELIWSRCDGEHIWEARFDARGTITLVGCRAILLSNGRLVSNTVREVEPEYHMQQGDSLTLKWTFGFNDEFQGRVWNLLDRRVTDILVRPMLAPFTTEAPPICYGFPARMLDA